MPGGFQPIPYILHWSVTPSGGHASSRVLERILGNLHRNFSLRQSSHGTLRGEARTFTDVLPPPGSIDPFTPVTATKIPCVNDSSVPVENLRFDEPAVDHIILAIDSLERGMDMFRRGTSIQPIYGGVHPGRGSRNALVSLGGGRYLEIIAPNPADTTKSGAERKNALAKFHRLTPYGWAVQTNNIDSVSAEFIKQGFPRANVSAGARSRPNGKILKWRTLDPWGTESTALPFFIEWDPSSAHPSTDAPTGCALRNVTVLSPNSDSMEALLIKGGIRVSVQKRRSESLRFMLRCRGMDLPIVDYSK